MLVFLKMSDSQSDETVILNVLEIKFFFHSLTFFTWQLDMILL